MLNYTKCGCFIVQYVAIPLCIMWNFCYAECGSFIAQNVDFLLCQMCIDAVCGSMVPTFSIDKAVYETAHIALRNDPNRKTVCTTLCARVHKNNITLYVSALCAYPQVINSIDLFGFVSEI